MPGTGAALWQQEALPPGQVGDGSAPESLLLSFLFNRVRDLRQRVRGLGGPLPWERSRGRPWAQPLVPDDNGQ